MSNISTAHATLGWKKELNTLSARWSGPVSSLEFKQVAQALVDLSQQHQLTKWFLHLEEMQEIDFQDESWLFTEWLQAFLDLGIKKIALVPSQFLDNHMSIEQLIKIAQTLRSFDVQYFTEEAEAYLWLDETATPDSLTYFAQN